MFKKIFGWILLISGMVLIIWTLISSYNIFTDKTAAPVVFKSDSGQTTSLGVNKDIQAQMEKLVEEQLKKIIPIDILLKFLNLAIWSFSAFIFITGGAQISNLGIKLINKQ